MMCWPIVRARTPVEPFPAPVFANVFLSFRAFLNCPSTTASINGISKGATKNLEVDVGRFSQRHFEGKGLNGALLQIFGKHQSTKSPIEVTWSATISSRSEISSDSFTGTRKTTILDHQAISSIQFHLFVKSPFRVVSLQW